MTIAVADTAAARHQPVRLRGIVALWTSGLARRIVACNLLAAVVLMWGVMWAAPLGDSLTDQREAALLEQVRLLAALIGRSAQVPSDLATVQSLLDASGEGKSVHVRVFDARNGLPVPRRAGAADVPGQRGNSRLTGALQALGNRFAEPLASLGASRTEPADKVLRLVETALTLGAASGSEIGPGGLTTVSAAAALPGSDKPAVVLVLTSPPGEIERLVRAQRQRLLGVFAVAVAFSIAISLALAATIARPLRQLADAAELGRDLGARGFGAQCVRIPDLTDCPDEIGRLSCALRGLVAALCARIDANKALAADLAHEIKNPLASLRAATEALGVVRCEAKRARLQDVIAQDVIRLDRLVSEISETSRLDRELVHAEQERFDVVALVRRLVDHLTRDAAQKGIEVITDLPAEPIEARGLEGRLAQVVVNVLGNAISFCDEGDAIRVWVRRRLSRVLIVIEDTGPGIREVALEKIFDRFYSERPPEQFGGNSGLGLAISKQIVEAHGGVIWAENIRPTQADHTSDPLGARFVIGLPA